MKKLILLFAFFTALQNTWAQNYNWAFGLGSPGNETCNSIARDASGNVYVAGSFEGTVDFNPNPNQTNNYNSTGLKDIYMAKYDAQGNYVWAVRLGSTGVDEAKFIRVNPANGDIYLAGTFQNSVDFDFGSPSAVLTAAGGYDIFFARYSSAGALLYARRIGNTNIELLDAMDLNTGTGNNGEITLMGRFTGTVDFDPNSATVNLVANGSEMFIAKYSNTFTFQNAYKFGPGSVYGKSVSFDNTNSAIYITGGFNGTVDFNFGTATNNLVAQSGNTDIFLAKYDMTLNYQWAVSMGGTSGPKEGRAIAIDNNNDAVLAGNFSGDVDLDPGSSTVSYTSTSTASDIFLAKYSGSNGALIWSNTMGGTGTDIATALVKDGSNNIYMSGAFQSTVDFDPSTSVNNFVSGGGDDAFFAKYNNNGNYLFASAISGGGNQVASAMVLTGVDNLYLCGTNSSTGTDFDPGPGTAIISSLGGNDGFVAKYNSCADPIIAVTQASSNDPCMNQNFTLSIVSGNLGGGTGWHWYSGSCGGTAVGTGTQIVTSVATSAGFYVRAEGGCLSSPGLCSAVNNIIPASLPVLSVTSSNSVVCSGQPATLLFSGATTYSLNSVPVTGSSSIVNPTVTTTYTISGYDGCTNSTVYTQQVMDCTGIESHSPQQNITIFPNPSTGQLFINGVGNSDFKIMDELGRQAKFSYEQTQLGIQINHLEPGMYLFYSNGLTQKIIVVR